MEERRYQEKMKVQVNDWRIPYIGRIVTEEFEKKFRYKDEIIASSRFVGIHKFEWDGHLDYVKENHFDESNYRHFLSVELFDFGAMKGRVKAIEVHYRKYWHTTSNWQDHGEEGVEEVDVNYENEIEGYCKLLDICTKSCSRDEAVDLFRTVVATSEEFDIVNGDLRCRMGGISVGCMANFIVLARSFLEVFFFGTLMEDIKDEYGAMLSQDQLRVADSCHDFFMHFIDRIDIRAFYDGMDLEKLKQEFVLRMHRQGVVLQRFLGINHRVYVEMIKSMMEDRIDSSERTFLKWGGCRECWGLESRPSACIPDNSLCFFNRKRKCVGYVTNENKAFKYEFGRYVLVGEMASDGQVYNSNGVCFGCGWHISANGLICNNVWLRHFEDRVEVSSGKYYHHGDYEYVGYVMVCKYETEGVPSSVRCEKYDWHEEGEDMRWIGLALLGYLDDKKLKIIADEVKEEAKRYAKRVIAHEGRN